MVAYGPDVYPSESTRQCVQDCLNTYAVCNETLAYCMQQGGRYAEPEVLRLLMDCAAINHLAADFLSRGSEQAKDAAHLCALVSNSCAEMCDRFDEEDDQLRICYAVCERSALACEQVSGERSSPEAADLHDRTVSDSFPASDPPPSSTTI